MFRPDFGLRSALSQPRPRLGRSEPKLRPKPQCTTPFRRNSDLSRPPLSPPSRHGESVGGGSAPASRPASPSYTRGYTQDIPGCHQTIYRRSMWFGSSMSPNHNYKLMGLGARAVTKPYKVTGFRATKPYGFTRYIQRCSIMLPCSFVLH